jgi:hypothetical protein
VTFSLRFELGTEHHIHGHAIVRWVRPQSDPSHLAGFGMEFGELSEAARRDLNRLLRLLSPANP